MALHEDLLDTTPDAPLGTLVGVWHSLLAQADNVLGTLWRPWVGYQVLIALAIFAVAHVLRMALARLREDGIITSRRGSGNYVTRRPDRAVMDFVPLGSITDIRRCYEFRADVESAAAAWAARRRTEADLAAMEAAQAQLAGSYRQQQLGVEADHQLHLAVARASGNPFYVTVLESLATQIAFGMTLSRSLTLQGAPDRQAKVEAEHRALIEAIRAADPEAAAAAMRRHIIAARDRMFEGGD